MLVNVKLLEKKKGRKKVTNSHTENESPKNTQNHSLKIEKHKIDVLRIVPDQHACRKRVKKTIYNIASDAH